HARARRLHATVAVLPAESLLLETDAPDQPGARHLGQRNEPAFLREVLHCVAMIPMNSRARRPPTHAACFAARERQGFGFSRISRARPAAANANAPVTCVAAPSPPPQSSFSESTPSGRVPHTLPSACG